MKSSNHEGRIIHKLFRGSMLVMTMAFAMATLGMLVDGIVVGKFMGSVCVSALGLCSPLFLIASAIGGAFAEGALPVCNRAMAEGDQKGAAAAFCLSVDIIVVFAIILSALCFIFRGEAAHILGAADATGALFVNTKAYITGFLFGIPAILGALLLTPFAQADGDQSSTIASIMAMTISNIALDFINVFSLKWGMLGIGLGTALSYYIGIIILATHFFKKDASYHFNLLSVNIQDAGEILLTGLPGAVGRLLLPFRTIILNHLTLAVGGGAALTAFAVQNSVSTFAVSPVLGIGAATLMMSSLLYGEEDRYGLEIMMRYSFRMAFLINGIIAVFIFAASGAIASLFVSEIDKAYEITKEAVRFYSLIIFFDSANGVYSNHLQAIGALKIAGFLNVLNTLVCATAFSFIFTPFMGAKGVWAAYLVGEICVTVITIIISIIREKNVSTRLGDYLFLPRDFRIDIDDELNRTITNIEEVSALSKAAGVFCKSHGADSKTAQAISLAVEELASNVLLHGFDKKVKEPSVDLRLIKKGDTFTVRIRDDAQSFNVAKYAELISKERDDPTKELGIRLVVGLGAKLNYVSTLNTNNLIITYQPKSTI